MTFRVSRFHLPIVLLALVAAGCASSHRFTVDAVQRPAVAADATGAAAYQLRFSAAAEQELADSLAQEQARADLHTALSAKGWYEAPPGTRAAFEVEVDFGIEGPLQRVVTHTEPVYVQTPTAPRPSGRAGAVGPTVARTPRPVAHREVTTVVTYYRKFLRLAARELGADGRLVAGAAPVWSVVVTGEDGSADLAQHVRLMAAAAMDVLGDDSGAERVVVLTNRDGRVRFIERGLEG